MRWLVRSPNSWLIAIALAVGLLRLVRGDIVYVRNMQGSGKQEDDKAHAWLLSEAELEEWRPQAEKIWDDMVGNASEIDTGKPKINNDTGVLEGGIWLERNQNIKEVGGGRCYSMGLMRQPHPNVSSELGVYALKSWDPSGYKAMDHYAEVSNLPRIGCPENCAFAGVQVNTASAVEYESAQSLENEMGDFGGKHRDKKDSVKGKSVMISTPKVPKNYEAGRFHLLKDGMYIELDNFQVMCFSGLQWHGGTPPRAPEGETPHPSGVRLNVILYPPKMILNGQSRLNIAPAPAPMPKAGDRKPPEPFRLAPEMINPQLQTSDHRADDCTEPTFTIDGLNLMAPETMANFVARVGVQVLDHLLRQLPQEWQVKMDPSAVLEAITMVSDNATVQLNRWEAGPNGRDFDITSTELRAQYVREWEDLGHQFAPFFPAGQSEMNTAPGSTDSTPTPAQSKKRKATHPVAPKPKRPKKNNGKGNMTSVLTRASLNRIVKVTKPSTVSARPARAISRRQTRSQKAQPAAPEPLVSQPPLHSSSSLHSIRAGVSLQARSSSSRNDCRLPRRSERQVSAGDVTGGEDDNVIGDDDKDEDANDDSDSVSEILDHYPTKVKRFPTHYLCTMPYVQDGIWMSWSTIPDATMLLDYHEARGLPLCQVIQAHIKTRSSRPPRGQLPNTKLRTIHPDSIVVLCDQFYHASNDLMNGKKVGDTSSLKQLDMVHKTLNKHPLEEETATCLANAASCLVTLSGTIDVSDALIVSAPSHPQSWFARLLSACRRIVEHASYSTAEEVELSSSSYLPLSPPSVYIVHHKQHEITQKRAITPSEVLEGAVAIMTNTILKWIGLPPSQTMPSRKRLLQTIWCTFPHPSIFLLEPISHLMHGDLKSLQKDSQCWNSKPWTLNDLLYASTAIEQLGATQGEVLMTHLDALTQARTSYVNAFNAPVGKAGLTREVQSILPGHQNPLDLFIEWLRATQTLLGPHPTSLSSLMNKIKNDTDGYLPFREHADSRAWIHSQQGPFTQSAIHTRGGIFSALIFRGITFRTEGLFHHSGLFNDLSAWKQFRGQNKTDEQWFCNISAYGPSKGRHTKHAQQLWDFSATLHEFLHQSPAPSFQAVVAMMLDLPSWGILTAYLCAVDLYYAGILEANEDDVAWFVASCQKGAANGLRKLGLDESSESFLHAFQYVDSQLTDDKKEMMGWDCFVMEHGLSLTGIPVIDQSSQIWTYMSAGKASGRGKGRGRGSVQITDGVLLDDDIAAIQLMGRGRGRGGRGRGRPLFHSSENEDIEMIDPDQGVISSSQALKTCSLCQKQYNGRRVIKTTKFINFIAESQKPLEEEPSLELFSPPSSPRASPTPAGSPAPSSSRSSSRSPIPTPILSYKSHPNNAGLFRIHRYFRPQNDPDRLSSSHGIDPEVPRTSVDGFGRRVNEQRQDEPSPNGDYSPFPNPTIFRLMQWHYNYHQSPSLKSLDALVRDVLLQPDFDAVHVMGFNSRAIVALMDKATVSPSSEGRPFDNCEGWIQGSVEVSMPRARKQTEEMFAPVLSIKNVHYRNLHEVVRTEMQEPYSAQFHLKPYKLSWQPPDRPIQRVYGEAYTSDRMLEFESEIMGKHQPAIEHEIGIVGLILYSDSTTCTNFGDVSMWPAYLTFANWSKNIRLKPKSFAMNHIIYIPSLPESIQKHYQTHFDHMASDNELRFCKVEMLQAIWHMLISDPNFYKAYVEGYVEKCANGIVRHLFYRFFSYAADYVEKVMLVCIKYLATHPCPLCLCEKDNVPWLGTRKNMKDHVSLAREDTEDLRQAIHDARTLIFEGGYAVASDKVKQRLDPYSALPTQSAFSRVYQEHGLNHFDMFPPDQFHDNYGRSSDFQKHNVRILYSLQSKVHVESLNQRYREVPTFGDGTIRRFKKETSKFSRFGGRDYEDALQCAMPCYEGLFPKELDDLIQDVTFMFATYISYSSLRQHTDSTLATFATVTRELGELLRQYTQAVAKIDTRETEREVESRLKRNVEGPRQPQKKVFSLINFKTHALGDQVRAVRYWGKADGTNTQPGEREHQRIKNMYRATNRKEFEVQVGRHVARQRDLHRKSTRHDWFPDKWQAEEMPPDDPESHILIPRSEKNSMKFEVLLDSNFPYDALVHNFQQKLQRHLMGRILDQDPDTIPDNDLWKIAFVGGRFYRHKKLKVNYTTYDLRRKSETISFRRRPHFMTLASGDNPSHPYIYGRVLGIYHVNVMYLDDNPARRTIQRMEVLFVRWFEVDSSFPSGWRAKRLTRLQFLAQEEAFGFVDPEAIIRASHLIPAFAHGRTGDLLQSDSLARLYEHYIDGEYVTEEVDWTYQYVNFFADRDMMMRYRGGGIGHITSHAHTHQWEQEATSNDRCLPVYDERGDCIGGDWEDEDNQDQVEEDGPDLMDILFGVSADGETSSSSDDSSDEADSDNDD
ncbi:hypothetical protein V5O48_004644 [Marasmius crinis-equi]|uniref:Uncharacterized protein n=1 Tax=Marasmius crinis-equi TaxID=585013 RepID=A0ABR3FPI6_9AGAR